MWRTRFFLSLLALPLAAALAAAILPQRADAQAAGPPPIRLIVPYAAGGLPDTVARMLAPHLAAAMDTAVAVDNRSGGSGAPALTALMQTPANGSAFMLTDGPLIAIAPMLNTGRSFASARRLVPVSIIGTAPLYLAVNPGLNVSTLGEMIELARSRPGALTYGSSGVGSIHHLTAESMAKAFGIKLLHVPFRGSSASVPAMIGGTVDMTFASPSSLVELARTGRTRLIAINSARRSTQMPEVPAIGERIPGFDFSFTLVVFARPGTPPDLVERFSQSIQQAVQTPEVAEQLRTAGLDPFGTTPAEAAWVVRFERSRIASAVQDAGLKR